MNRGREGVAASSGPAPDQPPAPLHLPRYSILPHSDPEHCFSIEPEDGTIRTAVSLDREARVWHNLTVLATEVGEESWAPGRPGRRQQPPSRGAVPGDVWGWGRAASAITPSPSVQPLGPQPASSPPGRPFGLLAGLGTVGLPEHFPSPSVGSHT